MRLISMKVYRKISDYVEAYGKGEIALKVCGRPRQRVRRRTIQVQRQRTSAMFRDTKRHLRGVYTLRCTYIPVLRREVLR
jgi:hypothetical protein